MGSIWLHDLPQWISELGVEVDTYPGWETRSRRSGGYDAVLAIGTHHTGGSGRYPKSEMKWMWERSPYEPVGAVYLSKAGLVTVGAAGATNTQGKGGPYAASRGTIPRNAGNRFVLSLEAANKGDGTPWPDAQLEAYARLCGGLAAKLGLEVHQDVISHATWAPGRKIDPSGQTPSVPYLGGDSGNVTWQDADFVRYIESVVQGVAPSVPTVPAPVMRRGSRGPNVSALIDLLKRYGWYPTKYMADHNDGVFGARTQAGVEAMQIALGGVTVNAVYDRPTAARLTARISGVPESGCTLPQPVRPGSQGHDVVELQQVLAGFGWYRYRIDGDYGPLTAQGVQKLQRAVRDAGHAPGPIDGWYGSRTRAAACDWTT